MRLIDPFPLITDLIEMIYTNDDPSMVLSKAGEQIWNAAIECVASKVKEQPVIDTVEIVRCKECKHAIVNENHTDKPLICCLTRMCGTTNGDWFCADGERKMDPK